MLAAKESETEFFGLRAAIVIKDLRLQNCLECEDPTSKSFQRQCRGQIRENF